MIRKTIAILFIALIVSCSSDENDVQNVNSTPGELVIESINFNGQKATVDWNDVIDTDKDLIYYKLYIDSKFITETTNSEHTISLKYNQVYKGKIFATDKKGGTSELEFTFNSPKSKIILFTDHSGNINAYDLITNKTLWTSKTSFIEASTSFENIVFTGLNGINAIDLLSGEKLWNVSPSIQYNDEYRSIITDKNNIYAFDNDSNLHCIDLGNKTSKWEVKFLNHHSTIAIDDSKVYVSNSYLHAFNKNTGNKVWEYELSSSGTSAAPSIRTNPLVAEDNIYFGSDIGLFYSLNKENGNLNWTFNAGLFNSFYASPTIYKNTIITASDKCLYALNKENGNVEWKHYKSNGVIESSPFVYNDNIYMGFSNIDGSGELICFNANSGSVRWKYNLVKQTTSSPIAYEGIVYIGDWNNTFYAIDTNTGTLKWEFKTKENATKSPTIVIGNSELVVYPSSHGLKN
ncbi:PQQ-binding-like beta-propeller repeat protein [uncultured Tenacibaculum sp.]|uniref:outer membrane protein assembly factor BamB family protein n=1 Tax=uncultured Tenacibaculum sp. TaxID=174713 RepID=UPI00261F5E4F|nr:PQQ-binding-like beta-propeller repeat protein [uncultured Tenacibaculum sp.]